MKINMHSTYVNNKNYKTIVMESVQGLERYRHTTYDTSGALNKSTDYSISSAFIVGDVP